MSDESIKIVYLVTTGVLSVIVLMYVGNSIFNAVDGEYISSPIALASLLISCIFWKKRIRNESLKIEMKV